jgi:hypothetical protein
VSSSMIMNYIPCHRLGLWAIVPATNRFTFPFAPIFFAGDIPFTLWLWSKLSFEYEDSVRSLSRATGGGSTNGNSTGFQGENTRSRG